jgi:hypothetical protein
LVRPPEAGVEGPTEPVEASQLAGKHSVLAAQGEQDGSVDQGTGAEPRVPEDSTAEDGLRHGAKGQQSRIGAAARSSGIGASSEARRARSSAKERALQRTLLAPGSAEDERSRWAAQGQPLLGLAFAYEAGGRHGPTIGT